VDPDLKIQLEKATPRNLALRALMYTCKTEAQFVHIVCVGAGDAFLKRYWPHLQTSLAHNFVKLTVADRFPLTELMDKKITVATEDPSIQDGVKELRRLYREFTEHVGSNRHIKYVDLSERQGRDWYDHLLADIVFILVPDEIHVKMARPWVRRANLIIVEKPYNRDFYEAVSFQSEMKKMTTGKGRKKPTTWVIAFDHYLAKIADYSKRREVDRLFRDPGTSGASLGILKKASFALLEPGGVESWRAESLRAGMTYDLFSHVLAMLPVELRCEGGPSDWIKRVAVARHKKCPESVTAETFAHFELLLKNAVGQDVCVEGDVGKGVGTSQEKWMRFSGQDGEVQFDLNPDGTRSVNLRKDGTDLWEKLYDVGNGHPELLRELLSGQYMNNPVGGMPLERAIAILEALNFVREKVRDFSESIELPEYEIGEPLDTIRNRAAPVI